MRLGSAQGPACFCLLRSKPHVHTTVKDFAHESGGPFMELQALIVV